MYQIYFLQFKFVPKTLTCLKYKSTVKGTPQTNNAFLYATYATPQSAITWVTVHFGYVTCTKNAYLQRDCDIILNEFML
jgi:hypothetical protein